MEPEVIAAIIALAGVILSTAISLIIGFWSKRYNYHHLFAETVSQSRNRVAKPKHMAQRDARIHIRNACKQTQNSLRKH